MVRPSTRPRILTSGQKKAFWKKHSAATVQKAVSNTSSKNRKNGRAPWFDQSGLRKREPVAVAPGILGTVRKFRSHHAMDFFIRRVRAVNQVARTTVVEHVQILPTRILSIEKHNNRILEQAYAAPTLHDLLTIKDYSELPRKSLYGMEFRRIMERKTPLAALQAAAQQGYRELLQAIAHARKEEPSLFADLDQTNVLVIDYSPKMNIVTLAVVDHGGSVMT